uniref:Uncharacterized protein n=1 Tax=Parastrongyloides trichosuri TaxID=131310 RepID=A0A0N4ZWU0_PARTI
MVINQIFYINSDFHPLNSYKRVLTVMDRSAYMSSPSSSGGSSSGGGNFVREEYAFGGPQQSAGSTQSDNQRNDVSCYLGGK